MIEGRSRLSVADQNNRVAYALEEVRSMQDRARAAFLGLDGAGELAVNRIDIETLRSFAAANPDGRYDLTTDEGLRRASLDLSTRALTSSLPPATELRLHLMRELYGDALPLYGLSGRRFYGSEYEQQYHGRERLSDTQRAALEQAEASIRRLGLDPQDVFHAPETYVQTLLKRSASDGATSPAAAELRAMRGRMVAGGLVGAATLVEAGLATIEVLDLIRAGRHADAASRLYEMGYGVVGEAMGAAGGAFLASLRVATLGMASTPAGLSFVLLSSALGAELSGQAMRGLFNGLHALGMLNTEALTEALQKAFQDNVPGVSLAADGRTLVYERNGEQIEVTRGEATVIVNGERIDPSAPPPEPGRGGVIATDPLGNPLGYVENPRCFLAGTPILMADGQEKPIEDIRVGDMVMSFDPSADQGRGALVPKPVSRTFQNITRSIIDLRGLHMTPGHVCLTDDGRFETIAEILLRDGILVEADGTPIRARTGAKIGSMEDIPVLIAYPDEKTGKEIFVRARAGIPCCLVREKDGTKRHVSLAQMLRAYHQTLTPDGLIQSPDGSLGEATDWPEDSTPMDEDYRRNWVIQTADGKPYVPEWILEVASEAREEQTVGATLRRITSPPSQRFVPIAI
jgi:hypothetical protein